jgi:hypothetical protein
MFPEFYTALSNFRNRLSGAAFNAGRVDKSPDSVTTHLSGLHPYRVTIVDTATGQPICTFEGTGAKLVLK